MVVRYAKFEDIKDIAKINVDGWKTAYKGIISDDFLNSLDYKEETDRKILENKFNKNSCCVYESNDNKVLGFCKFGERRNIELEGLSEYDCELIALYVRPDCKGQGIGKEIFKFVLKECKEKGKNKMILWVLEDNYPTIEFYKKMGGEFRSKKKTEIGNKSYNEISFGFNL